MRRTILPTVLLLGLVLTACSGSSNSSTAASSGAAGSIAAPPAQAQAAPARLVLPSAVVRTGDLDVQVDDVTAAAERASALVRAAGGRVDSDERSTAERDGNAVLVLRLPPKNYATALDALAGLGSERSRNLGVQDVSDNLVDLDARLATQRTSVTQVRTLLDRASTVGEVVQVEGELTKRTAELESLEGRVQELRGRVSLGSLTLRLSGRSVAPPPARASALGFGDGLAGGWSTLRAVGRALAVTTGALLPFVPLLLVAAFVGWRVRARRTRPRVAAAATP